MGGPLDQRVTHRTHGAPIGDSWAVTVNPWGTTGDDWATRGSVYIPMGRPMANPWEPHGPDAWETHGADPWEIHGPNPWPTHESPGPPRWIHGRYMGDPWDPCGTMGDAGSSNVKPGEIYGRRWASTISPWVSHGLAMGNPRQTNGSDPWHPHGSDSWVRPMDDPWAS